MINLIKKWFYILSDRCEYCGSELNIWSAKKAYCKKCNKLN